MQEIVVTAVKHSYTLEGQSSSDKNFLVAADLSGGGVRAEARDSGTQSSFAVILDHLICCEGGCVVSGVVLR